MSLPSYVGRYEVRDEIATGGFAVVLRAWDEELESFVALKILHREMFRDEDVQVRFLEESRLLRRIRSPNVVTVHDVGRLSDGRPYFVMDFADRGTLEPRLMCEKGAKPLDPQGITALVDALADGLSAIHDAGVVHRDIKPANILFQQTRRGATDPDTTGISQAMTQSALVEIDERILVGDLGIAKDLVKHGATATIIGGTPLYQAPEQDDLSAEIMPTADIYAATALLWHVLTGVKPPKASGVKERVGSLPPAWHDVMLQGMAMSPQDRFGCMESWRGAVHQALASEIAEARAGAPVVSAQSSAPCPR